MKRISQPKTFHQKKGRKYSSGPTFNDQWHRKRGAVGKSRRAGP